MNTHLLMRYLFTSSYIKVVVGNIVYFYTEEVWLCLILIANNKFCTKNSNINLYVRNRKEEGLLKWIV